MIHDIHLRYMMWFFKLSCAEPGHGLDDRSGSLPTPEILWVYPQRLSKRFSPGHSLRLLKPRSCPGKREDPCTIKCIFMTEICDRICDRSSSWRALQKGLPQGLCYQMCYIKDLKKEGISEVKFAGETIQEVKQRTNLKNLTVLSNCSVKKQQMKCSTDHCRVNHRHKIHLTSFNKIKGFELITEFREKLLGL